MGTTSDGCTWTLRADSVWRCDTPGCQHHIDRMDAARTRWLCVCCAEAETQAAVRRMQGALL